jgi:DNA-directed RNA polymerase specialized sigma24 family protein
MNGLPEREAALAATLYVGGWQLRKIGARLRASHELVRSCLVSRGVVMRPQGGSRGGRPLLKVDLERVQMLRAGGLSTRQIAKRLGVSRDTIRRRLA